ncbi:DUF2716 domain-containing protein [Streptomyces sp. NPDC041068]|uniref:DUF2716 domain-containing protein n=1 Tax=Streptomyces sp. NPDC041068 TaxID=3155130 RepID=UPI003411C156
MFLLLDVVELLSAHDEQVRGRVPERPPMGAVTERDGPLVRTHYGTHGTVDHRPLPWTSGDDLADMIRRQQARFGARSEPVEWKAYAHDGAVGALAAGLTAAGFTPGWERAVLVAELDRMPRPPRGAPGTDPRTLESGDDHLWQDVYRRAAASGPHRAPLSELEADGRAPHWELNVDVLRRNGVVRGAGWAHLIEDTEFVGVGGMTGPHMELIPRWAAWAKNRSDGIGGGGSPRKRFMVAEADGALREAFLAAGFRQITTVRSFHWAPQGSPAATRPVRMLLRSEEYDDVRERFDGRFHFVPSMTHYPGIAEPEASVTWHVGEVAGTSATRHGGELDRIVRLGLRACARPGEQLYYADPYHQGYRFDPHRVEGPGLPPWPRAVYREGDYALHLTHDLRLGTFAHPWEESLCVFGAELLAEVAEELDEVLGRVMRRGGRNEGNVWTFGAP